MTPATLTLLHTGDMHGRLTAAAADRIRREKEAAANALLVDAGDAIRAGNLGVTLWGETVLDLMGYAGYDLMAAGNRETHLWQWAVRAKTRTAAFPVLCANVSGPGAGTGPPGTVTPKDLRAHVDPGIQYHRSVVVRLPNGLRVAVFGLTVPMVTEAMPARRVSHYVFHDPIETARALVPELAGGADVVVALTHLGLAADRELAHAVPGIHLIVGGHSHDLTAEPEEADGVPILHAGSHARWLGKAEVSLQDGRATVHSTLIALKEDGGRRRRP